MKFTAICVLALQIVLFVIGSFVVLWSFGEAVKDGGGFVAGFEKIQFWRLIAFLAPYLAIPISTVITFILFRKKGTARRYGFRWP